MITPLPELVGASELSEEELAPLPPGPSFLADLTIDYGPSPFVGEFLLRADATVRSIGISLELAPLSEIAVHNARVPARDWGPFSPILDTRVVKVPEGMGYCLLGRTRTKRVVVAQAGRIFDTANRSLQDMADDLSLYYGSEPFPGGEQPRFTLEDCPAARAIRGRFLYSGALWVHPEYRKLGLSALLPRISRVYALGTRNTQYTVTFVSDSIKQSKLMAQYGYPGSEGVYKIFYGGRHTYTGSLSYLTTSQMLDETRAFESGALAQIDRRIADRSRENQAAPVA
ncbi:MAG: hypothetical protein R3D33_01980 [Hyphomicrobiaceae bacterium]